jgi:hypothetical protein
VREAVQRMNDAGARVAAFVPRALSPLPDRRVAGVHRFLRFRPHRRAELRRAVPSLSCARQIDLPRQKTRSAVAIGRKSAVGAEVIETAQVLESNILEEVTA